MHRVTSRDNHAVKLAASLKQRKYRRELGMFLVEGRRGAIEAKQRPQLIHAIFVEEDLARDRVLLEGFDPEQIYVVDAKTIRHICSTEQPQGIALVLSNPVWDWEPLVKTGGKILLLDRLSDPGNLGSILRSAWALWIDGVLLSPGCVDHLSPKVVRASMGAVFNLPVFSEAGAEHLDRLAQQGYAFVAADASCGQPYDQCILRSPVVLIMGSEAHGLDDELRMRCQGFVNIPMHPRVESLNVAAACAIIMAEIARQSHAEN